MRLSDDVSAEGDSLQQFLHAANSPAAHDWSQVPPSQRPKHWWKVSDGHIDALVGALAKSQSEPSLPSPTAKAGLSMLTEPPISLHLLLETGKTLSLKVPLCLKAGPSPPPRNALTDVFGPGASSKGFEQELPCSFRHARNGWTHVKAASLKGLVSMATGLEPARQQLCHQGGVLRREELTLRAVGLRDGEMLELQRMPSPRVGRREVLLACSRKKSESRPPKPRKRLDRVEDFGRIRNKEGEVQILPRWNKGTSSDVFAKVGIAVDGQGGYRAPSR